MVVVVCRIKHKPLQWPNTVIVRHDLTERDQKTATWWSCTSHTVVACLPNARCYRACAKTGCPGVNIL